MTDRSRIISVIIHMLLITAVVAAAVFVRSASSSFTSSGDKTVNVLTDENGLPYLTDMDSYYHVRLVSHYIEAGTLGDSVSEDSIPWDLHSYAPEGRSADYQPAIVWVTTFAWRLTGSDPDSLAGIEYRISAIIASLSALVAYVIGVRIGGDGISGKVCGTAAGILVSCSPQFAVRTCYGRFDTDMFVVLMELILILFMTESIRASRIWQKALFAVLFAGSAVLYAQCWAPQYAMLFAGLTAMGGGIWLIVMAIVKETRPASFSKALSSPSLWAVFGGGILTLAGLIITIGPSIITSVLNAMGFSTSSGTGEGVLPNLLASISELGDASLLPRSITNIFSGYVGSERPSIINGVGGLIVFGLALGALVWLLILSLPRKKSQNQRDLMKFRRQDLIMYLCVLGVWFAACMFLMGYGVRFIEHLSIPVGLLAAAFLGLLIRHINSSAPERKRRKDKKDLIIKQVLAGILCVVTVIPSVTGSVRASSDSRPSVSKASVKAMEFIDSDSDSDALIASWWDMGYFYESQADRACLWDGGSQDGARAVMVSKALVTDDMELSRRIILMLSENGNAAIDLLMEKMPVKDAFDVLWKALVTDKDGALALLRNCGMNEEDAVRAEALIHPVKTHEAYLILTFTMTRQIGWYEYYANWDFTGKQELPAITMYSYTPDGTPVFNTKEGQEYLNNVRGNEAMWRLFFDAEKTSCYTPAFEYHDGVEHVRIWRVEG